jgi:TctA family transporter
MVGFIPYPCGESNSASAADHGVEVAALLHACATEAAVLLTIAFVCILLWLLGVMTTTTIGSVLHVLLVIAIVLFLVHIIQGSSIGNA